MTEIRPNQLPDDESKIKESRQSPEATIAPSTATQLTAKKNENEKSDDDGELINFEQFLQVQLKVGQVLEASEIKKSKKLLKLLVDVGDASGPRQIIAGIAKHYEAQDLVGRKVAVVANLKPAKLMGLESQGMLLCASDDALGTLELLSPGNDIPAGSSIS